VNETNAKNKIIKTTISMIERNGYNNITTNHIAKQAKVSIGTLYYHFKNGKPDIIKEIINRGYNEFLNESNLNSLTADNLPLFLKSFLSKYLEQHREHESLIIALETAFISNRKIFQDFEYIRSELKLVPLISNLLKQLGYPNKGNLDEISKFILYLIDSIIHHQIIHGEYLLKNEELINNLTNLLLKFLNYKVD
jgi:AcrR family transcriptional regulator